MAAHEYSAAGDRAPLMWLVEYCKGYRMNKGHKIADGVGACGSRPRLASASARIFGYLIDCTIAWLIAFPVLAAAGSAEVVQILGVAAAVAYMLLRDALPDGQSIGKRIMGIRTVSKVRGEACSLGQSIVRNLLLVVPGIIDWLLWMHSVQRLGDVVAKTCVITKKLYSQDDPSLADSAY